MTYSSAIFDGKANSLEAAQRLKYAHVMDALDGEGDPSAREEFRRKSLSNG